MKIYLLVDTAILSKLIIITIIIIIKDGEQVVSSLSLFQILMENGKYENKWALTLEPVR